MPVVFDEVTARVDDESDDDALTEREGHADAPTTAMLSLARFAQLTRDWERRRRRLSAD